MTAANSSQVTDGAALLVLASEEAVARYQLPILGGQLIDTSWSGLQPEEMGGLGGPVYAMDALLRKHADAARGGIDLWEINEAFAAQVLACLAALDDDEWQRQELGDLSVIPAIDPNCLNVDGGASL